MKKLIFLIIALFFVSCSTSKKSVEQIKEKETSILNVEQKTDNETKVATNSNLDSIVNVYIDIVVKETKQTIVDSSGTITTIEAKETNISIDKEANKHVSIKSDSLANKITDTKIKEVKEATKDNKIIKEVKKNIDLFDYYFMAIVFTVVIIWNYRVKLWNWIVFLINKIKNINH